MRVLSSRSLCFVLFFLLQHSLCCEIKESEKKNPAPLLLSHQSAPKVNEGVFWAETHPQSKFDKNLFFILCVFLLIN